ncbi:MAG TPA: hypothetical protein VFV51_17405, partial [Vicinamibacterales bacterium]|nr:hypothetical protein [Vicinamibacterales bacterium]
TNDRGIISVSSSGEPGIVIDATGLSTSFLYFAKIVSVNGVQVSCALPTEYTLSVTDREYSESYGRGTAISGAIGIPLIGVEGSAEAGMSLKRKQKFLTGIQSLDISSSFETQGKVGAEFALFEFKAGVGIGQLNVSAEVGISGAKSDAKGASYSFPYPLQPEATCAFANLTLTGMLNVNPLIPKLLDLVRQQPCAELSRYLTSTSREFGRTATDSGKVGVGLTTPLQIGWKKIGVNFGGSGSAGFGLKTSYENAYTVDLTTGVLNGTTLKEGYQLTGGFDFSVGLNVSASEPPSPYEDDEDQTELEGIASDKFKVGAGITGTTVETYKVEFAYDLANLPAAGRPSSISVSYTGPKTWGWTKTAQGVETKQPRGASSSISYTIEDADAITAVIDALVNMKTIRDTNVQTQLAFLELQLVPTILNEEYSKFRSLLRKMNVSYSIDASEGEGTEIPLGLKGKLLGFKLGAGLSIKSDQKLDYNKETGVVVKGVMYPHARYTDDAFIPTPTFGLWDTVETVWDALLASFAGNFSDKNAPVNPSQPTASMKSDATATIVINSAAEPEPFDAGLFSYKYRIIDGPVREARALPADTAGPAGKPHYGIGGFHHLTPGDRQLAAPASLVIDYRDDELDGVDESTLAIFGWNSTTKDWELVGGTLDMAANTVSTTITTLRLYTLGPRRMPARDIELTYQDLGTSGEQANMVQRFRVTAGTLQTNTGEAVPDGTLYTIKSVIAGTSDTFDHGTITAADADPAREGIQLAVSGGTFSFEVEYPAPFGFYSAGKAVVFSTTGTAFGQQVLTP